MKKTILIKTDYDKALVQREIAAIDLKTPVRVKFETETRTLEQNAAQWPILQAFAEQVKWSVNGEMEYLTANEWKDVLTSAYRCETRVRIARAFGGGGVVMLGQRTSKFTKSEFPEWLEFLNFAAAEYGVKIPISKKQAAFYE